MNNVVDLMSIRDMQNFKFYIDIYQRGYRWTQDNVEDLLNDICEFQNKNNDNNNNFYCLQPIVLKKRNEYEWTVIDGQQRLTTLYLIYLYFYANKLWEDSEPFEITHYDKKGEDGAKNLDNFLKDIKDKKIRCTEELDEAYQDDIDCYYALEAYKVICNFPNEELNAIKEVLCNKVKVIWYEIDSNEDEVEAFRKINMGKIPLTNSELIKSLLLRNDIFKGKEQTIATEWNAIEARLSRPPFWSFLVNTGEENDYSTRMDLIFKMVAHDLNKKNEEKKLVDDKSNREYFSFLVLDAYINQADKKEKEKRILHIWDKVKEYDRMFRDWYQNEQWYNRIGLLIILKKDSDFLKTLTVKYKESGKEAFKKYLNTEIAKFIFKFELNDDNIDTNTVDDIREIIAGLNFYDNHIQIYNVLLLFNIAVQEIEYKSKFPFHRYKHSNKWDIEHITATADKCPKSDNSREEWITACEEIIKLIADNKLRTELQGYIYKCKDKKEWKSEDDIKEFNEIYNEVIEHFGKFNADNEQNSIKNLALLDSHINRSYKNAIFPVKRKRILEVIKKGKEEIYVTPGTLKVFLKSYEESNHLLMWEKEDREAYFKDIISKIREFLGIEGNKDDGE